MTTDERRSSGLAFHAFGLAVLITGDDDRAIASLDAASRTGAVGTGYLAAVRREARARRAPVADPELLPRPAALAEVSFGDWAVLERVAFRGMTIGEAAVAVGIEKRDALRRLQRALTTAGRCLGSDWQARGDTEAAGSASLGADVAAGRAGDPARDGEAEPAALDSDAV